MLECLKLFLLFAKIGVMTFGGGYAMLPILQRELVEKRGWTTEEELADYFAIGQCTPGVIAVNTATFLGHKRKGICGGIFATLGVVFPSLVIISALAVLISHFADIPAVQNAFAGIRVCVCVLILNAVCKLWKGAVNNLLTFGIFLVILVVGLFVDVSPILFILAAAIVGIVLEALHVMPKGDAKKS